MVAPDQPDLPLSDVRIVDLSRVVAGNMASHVLADFGAEVIKVETPGRGDGLRDWTVKEVATHWKAYCRNKKSLCLNLRDPEGKKLLLRLIEHSHVFIENYRPGTLEAMGLGPDVLHETCPHLIILRISGFGQTGPYRLRPGFGTLVEAMSTFAAMNGFADREPVLPPGATADMVAGLYGAIAVLISLHAAARGKPGGEVIDLSLLEPFFAILGPRAADYRVSGKVKQRTGNRSTSSAPRNIYRTADGKWLALSASTQETAERLFRAIGREDMVSDPRFRTNSDRLRNVEELDQIIGEAITARSLKENLEFFGEKGVAVGPVYDIIEFIRDPHVVERQILVEVEDDDMGSLPLHAVTPRLSKNAGKIRWPAPRLGQHTREVLQTIGLEAHEIQELERRGVVHSVASSHPER